QLILLLLRQRLGDYCLLRRLRIDRPLVELPAGGGDLDLDGAAIALVGHATHEARVLETVEPVRHRGARELDLRREVTRPAAPGGGARERTERVPFAGAQPVLVERLVEHSPDPAVDASDPVDDPLDPQVECRQLDPDLLQPPVDVVLLSGLCHGEILQSKTFDVKYLALVTFDLEILETEGGAHGASASRATERSRRGARSHAGSARVGR